MWIESDEIRDARIRWITVILAITVAMRVKVCHYNLFKDLL